MEDVENINFSDTPWDNLAMEDVGSTRTTKLIYQTTKQAATDDSKCNVFEGAILRLLEWSVGLSCGQCDGPMTFTTIMYATCMMVKWMHSARQHAHGIWLHGPLPRMRFL